jgi:hypothetical protein
MRELVCHWILAGLLGVFISLFIRKWGAMNDLRDYVNKRGGYIMLQVDPDPNKASPPGDGVTPWVNLWR